MTAPGPGPAGPGPAADGPAADGSGRAGGTRTGSGRAGGGRPAGGNGAASGRPGDALGRRLGTGDAVLIGLGSMLGAGVFAVFAPAARAAGTGLLLGLAAAAVVAYCNATSSAQLAAAYPTSGGSYVYGRERLGEWWGFAAGWAFVAGKTASCAAMARTFADYAVPGPWWARRAAAVAAVVALAAVNYRGVTRTATLTRVLVGCTLAALAVAVAAIWARGASLGHLGGAAALTSGGWYGTLQAAGLVFFAFAGYARIATMGEEVRDPARTIPRAIPAALLLAVAVYAVVAVSALAAAGPAALAGAPAPLVAAAGGTGAATGWGAAVGPVLRAGGALASLGALLALVAGVGRTALAMARGGDLPRWLAAVHPRYRVPHRAEVVQAAAVCALTLAADVRTAIGFSSTGVLLYYAIANASAFTQPARDRRWPRALQVLGVAGCLVLVAALPVRSLLAGLAVLAAGLAGRLAARRLRAPGRPARRTGQL
jgi:basic amino acid/polyamine antiporter, APA family